MKRLLKLLMFWKWFSKKRKEDKPAQPVREMHTFTDDLDVSAIRIHGIDWSGWPAKYELELMHNGNGVHLYQDLTKELDSIDENVGSCWFIVRRDDQRWHGCRWDQIRAGQTSREFPWNPPHPKEGESYPTAKRQQEVYVCVTSMARDHKRNGNVRTAIRRLQ